MSVALSVAFLLSLLPTVVMAESGSQGPGQVDAHSLWVSASGKDVRHLVFTPSGYGADSDRRYPLIVGLHGTAGDPAQVMEFQRLQELADRYGYMIVCPHSSGRGDFAHRYVLRVVDHVLETYRVDAERIFLMGFSRGGGGVWELGQAYADRWAGLAPISPATKGDTSPLDTMTHLPVIVVIGDQDEAVSQSAVRRWVARMEELNMTHQFVELPGAGHQLDKVNFLPLIFEFFERHPPVRSLEPHDPANP